MAIEQDSLNAAFASEFGILFHSAMLDLSSGSRDADTAMERFRDGLVILRATYVLISDELTKGITHGRFCKDIPQDPPGD